MEQKTNAKGMYILIFSKHNIVALRIKNKHSFFILLHSKTKMFIWTLVYFLKDDISHLVFFDNIVLQMEAVEARKHE